ncbi:hypothetical protein FI667_g10179, partial [Globisporangium splendens]
MWKRIARKGFGNEAVGFMAVPVQVVVPDQVVPVFFLLVARLTGASLMFSMDRIDFGDCPLGHSVFHVLTIENTVRVPQHFGFMKLPPEIRVEDSAGGVGSTLLPREKKTVKLIYQPSTAIPLQSKLSVRTSLNQEYHLPCAGNCISIPLVFSHNVVQLRATQVGQSQAHSILCSNISERAQHLEFLLPEGSGKFLRISPLVSRIEPGKSVRIEIEFSPTDDLFDLPEGTYEASLPANPPCNDDADAGDELKANVSEVSVAKSTASAASVNVNRSSTALVPPLRNALLVGKGGDKETPWQLGIPPEERSVHHRWSVLCFRRAETVKERVIQGTLSSSPLLAIQVETTTIEPKLLAEPAKLDYSQVAIGQSLVMDLKLTNASKADIVIASKPLHVLGGFRVVNSLRPIKSGDTHVIKMEFKPQSPIVYDDELCLSSPSIGAVRVPLRGEGINPSLSIQPPDGWLDFKDVLVRSKSVLELVLSNASSFPLTYSIVLWPESTEASIGSNGLPVFTFTPSDAMIPAQGTLAIKVGFNPMAQRPKHYKQQFRIKVPNESENHLLTLTGRCWEDQLYVYSPVLLDLSPATKTESARSVASLVAPPLIEDPFDLPPSVSLNQLSSGGSTASSSSLFTAGLRKPQPTIVITFDEGHTSMQPLIIGSTLPLSDDESHTTAASGGKTAASSPPAGSFELVLVENPAHPEYAKLFSLEPMKGTLAAGQQVQVQATLNDPQSLTEDHDAAESALRSKQKHLIVSQWVQVHAICTLRGGVQWRQFPQPPGSGGPLATGNPKTGVGGTGASDSESRTVQITLRAQVQICSRSAFGAAHDRERRRRRKDMSSSTFTLARCVAILLCCSAWSSHVFGLRAVAESVDDLLHLYPETPRPGERLRCGDTQHYRVHDLDPRKVYDVKVSYPATIPTEFFLEVEEVLLPPPVSIADASPVPGVMKGTMRVRRRILNTAKLRLRPHELLLQALGKDPVHSININAYRLDLQQNGESGGKTGIAGSKVTLDISLRAEVEGVSPTIDLSTRECVFDIVVEEMLFGAFPYDTLVLVVWLVFLLLVGLKWVYPYMLKKIALELPEEQPLSHDMKES